jgi:hypothetical protein
MIDLSSCVRYALHEDVDSFCQKLITWLRDSYPEIFLIHQESNVDHNQALTRLTLIHRHWGPSINMEIIPIDSTQTLILIPAPPDPGLEDVSSYETKILENLPGSSASIRLARVDGNDEKASTLMRNVLREQRHHCWMNIHSGLISSFRLVSYEGDPEELIQDIPKADRDIDQSECYPSQDEILVLELWAKGYTAKQIALHTGRTEKTILNRLTMMRRTYGEQLVPRRRTA